MTLGALLAVVACVSSRAAADPLRVVYRIDVFQKCTFVDNAIPWTDFRASFPLTLMFDSHVRSMQSDDSHQSQSYGEPTVSAIPLPPLRPDFPTLAPNGRSVGEGAQFFDDRQAWVRSSGVVISEFLSASQGDFHRDFSLNASGEFLSRPQLDAQSLATFLGTAPFRQFSLADALERADGGFELAQYVGHVSLEAPGAATPEPSSLLLVATGILSIAWRRRQGHRPR